VVVVFGFAGKVELPAGGNLSLWVYGTACEMLKIGLPLMTWLADCLPPVIRWVMDEASVMMLLLLGKSSIAKEAWHAGSIVVQSTDELTIHFTFVPILKSMASQTNRHWPPPPNGCSNAAMHQSTNSAA
jgi:hypothetical protein